MTRIFAPPKSTSTTNKGFLSLSQTAGLPALNIARFQLLLHFHFVQNNRSPQEFVKWGLDRVTDTFESKKFAHGMNFNIPPLCSAMQRALKAHISLFIVSTIYPPKPIE